MIILIMGLPGSGKTWLAERLQKHLDCAWFNADEVRRMTNDWHFDNDARLRQARRMRNLAKFEKSEGRTVICDFVCPTELTRHIFEADLTIWMDTIPEGRYENTNRIFERPREVDLHIDRFISEAEVVNIVNWIAGVHT
jgi:adenylylsulfate kinase